MRWIAAVLFFGAMALLEWHDAHTERLIAAHDAAQAQQLIYPR